MKLEQLLTINQIAQLLGVSGKTVYRYVHEHYIPFVKLQHLVRFRESEVAEWLEKKNHKGRSERVPSIY